MGAVTEPDRIVIHANYEVFVLLLVLLSVANSVLLVLPLVPEGKHVVAIVDFGVSLFLILDAFGRLFAARNKRRFLVDHHGWLVLVGSLPLPGLRLARLLYTWLLARKLRRSDYATMQNFVIERRAQTTLVAVAVLAVAVLEVAGILILGSESGVPNANIKTASDALWWGLVTVSTIGYGDKYPVTNQGRIVALFVMIIGIGLFSVLTGFLADWFRAPRERQAKLGIGLAKDRPDDLGGKLEEMRRLLDEQERAYQQASAEIKARLEEIESALPTRG